MSDTDIKAREYRGSPYSTEGSLACKLVKPTSASTAEADKAKSAAAEDAVSEIAAKPDRVGDAIKRCKAVANGGSVFKGANACIFEGLAEAYPTFLLIKNSKVEHQRVIDELMAKGDRERKPSLNKGAYNAAVLACHPDNPEDYSLCSDWSNVLTLADLQNVTADDFTTWVKDKKIGESKRKVRAAKQANKPLKPPVTEGDFPALAYVFKHCDDERMRQTMKEALASLDKHVGETLAALEGIPA